MIAYLLAIRHGGSFFGGPSSSVEVHYGAIPYELTNPGKHCGLQAVQDLSGNVGQEVLCGGQTLPTGAHVPNPSATEPATAETVLTSMFLHGSFLHIAGNMLFLAIFGPNVEDSMGRVRFLAFYLLGGLVALGAQVIVDPSSSAPTLGASGAIAAVLGGYIVLYPRARILSLVLIVFFATLIEVPAVFLLGFWFLEQIYFGAAGLSSPLGGGGGVAYFAHVGGFVFGLALIGLFATRRKSVPPRLAVY